MSSYILIPNLIHAALGKGQAVISEEELKEKQANRTGERVEMLPAGSKPAAAKGWS